MVYKFVYNFLEVEAAIVGHLKVSTHTAAGRGAIELRPPSGAGTLAPDACGVWSWSRDTAIVSAVALVARTGSIEISGYVTAAAGVEHVQASVFQSDLAICPAGDASFAPPSGSRTDRASRPIAIELTT